MGVKLTPPEGGEGRNSSPLIRLSSRKAPNKLSTENGVEGSCTRPIKVSEVSRMAPEVCVELDITQLFSFPLDLVQVAGAGTEAVEGTLYEEQRPFSISENRHRLELTSEANGFHKSRISTEV